jgi:hypothetical protein
MRIYFPKVRYHHAIGIQDELIFLEFFFIFFFRLYLPFLLAPEWLRVQKEEEKPISSPQPQ